MKTKTYKIVSGKGKGDTITLKEVKSKGTGKKRDPSWYNVCVKDKLRRDEASDIKGASKLCTMPGVKEKYLKKIRR